MSIWSLFSGIGTTHSADSLQASQSASSAGVYPDRLEVRNVTYSQGGAENSAAAALQGRGDPWNLQNLQMLYRQQEDMMIQQVMDRAVWDQMMYQVAAAGPQTWVPAIREAQVQTDLDDLE